MPVRLIQTTPSAYTYPLLIKQLLHMALATAPEQEIVYMEAKRYTYRTFAERIGRLANALTAQGVEAGQTVAVMDWDSHRYLECFFAVPMLGAVLQTVNIRLSPEQILYTLNHAKADVLLVNTEFFAALSTFADKLETVKKFIVLSDDVQLPPNPVTKATVGEYEALLAASQREFDFPDFDENACATTFYTTGTTGQPKGVYFSHRQLVMHTLAVTAGLGTAPTQGRLHRNDVYMPITPMFHVHAWGFPYVATMLGLKQVYPGRYQPDLLLKLIQKEKVTVSHCVPTILHMLLNAPLINEVDLSQWKIVIGGSALPQAMALVAMQRGIDIFTGYGMSETCPILTLAHLSDAMLASPATEQAKIRSKTGLPVPLVDLRIVNGEMHDVAHDGEAQGEVVVRSPWLTQGYLGNPEASEELWAGGYLHTSDIGTMDAAGYLQVTDRIKDVIKVGGEWVSSLQLEDLIAQHPSVSEVAVIGVKDDKWGERPLALVVLKPQVDRQEEKAIAKELSRHVVKLTESGNISRYAILVHFKLVDALPRTSVGKLNKMAMRAANL